MKLSEQLIEQAEWWIAGPEEELLQYTEVVNHVLKVYGSVYESPRFGLNCSGESFLCLFEAEYQKDIESQEYKSIAPSVERNMELLSDWAKRHIKQENPPC